MGGDTRIGNSTFTIQNSKLLQPQHVLHVVEAGGLVVGPEGGAQGAAGEGFAAGSFVGEFDALALRGVDDGVIADDVAAAHGVDPDLVLGAFTDDAVAAMA